MTKETHELSEETPLGIGATTEPAPFAHRQKKAPVLGEEEQVAHLAQIVRGAGEAPGGIVTDADVQPHGKGAGHTR